MAQSRKKKTNIPMRRRLSALYETGRDVRFGSAGVVNRSVEDLEASKQEDAEPDEDAIYPSDDDIVVFVTPPSPLQREQALREASASRARYVIGAKKDEDSIDSVTARASLVEMEDDEIIEFLLSMDEADRRSEAERNVKAEEEWSDFTELQDAIRQWAEADAEDDDEKWKPLLARDLEFGRQVETETERITEASRESLKIVSRTELEKRASKKLFDMGGNAEFMSEYQMWMLHYACRDGEDHDTLAFEGPDDINSMPEIVAEAISEVYREFIDTERSAKNSPRAAAGSESSVPPAEQEISESSTPEESTA